MILYDSSSQGNILSGGGLSWSWSHTITGAHPVLVVGVYTGNGSPPSAVTWGSQPLVKIADNGGNMSLWCLANAHTGTDGIAITQSGGGTPSYGFASSYINCSSVQPDSHDASTITTGHTLTSTPSVANQGCWLVGFSDYSTNGGSPISSYTSNFSDRQTQTYTSGSLKSIIVLSDSNSAVATGAQSITWTAATSNSGPSPAAWGLSLSLAPYPPTILYDSSNTYDSLFGTPTGSYTNSSVNGIMVVAGIENHNASAIGGFASMTFNGISLTKYKQVQVTGSPLAGGTELELWYLLNPPVGSHTFTATPNDLPNTYAACVVATYGVVKQTGFPDSNNTGTSSSTPFVISDTVVADDSWLIGVAGSVGASSPFWVYSSPGMQRNSITGNSSTARVVLGDSLGGMTAGSYNITFTNNTASPAIAGIVIGLEVGTLGVTNGLFMVSD